MYRPGIHVQLLSTVFLAMFLLTVLEVSAQRPSPRHGAPKSGVRGVQSATTESELEQATLGGGCFWCTEAFYEQLKGVHAVVSGYSGGHVRKPTYKQVLTGMTGHAEVVQITYNPRVISYKELLEVFWKTHDPTTRNRQGVDVGPQYRSVIFTHNQRQRQLATTYKNKLNESGAFAAPIVTEIVPFQVFFPAEAYHQDYHARNGRQPYCRMVISPKIKKFKKVFGEKLKDVSEPVKKVSKSNTQ